MLPEFQIGVSIINGLLSLFRSIKDLFSKGRKPEGAPDDAAPLMVARRFVQLFDQHGVKRSQIPTFFGHGLTLENLKDDETLLSVLTDEHLRAACERFAVRREWLDGASDTIYESHDFYKHPDAFKEFIENILSQSGDGCLDGYVFRLPQRSVREDDALIVLKEDIGSIGDRTIFRFRFSNPWVYKYWKSKVYLAACIGIAWDKGVYLHGIETDTQLLKNLMYGKGFVGYDYEDSWPAIPYHHKKWDAEDIVIDPNCLIEHIDEDFGHKAAISQWLQMYEEGYMRIKSLPLTGIKDRFVKALEENP